MKRILIRDALVVATQDPALGEIRGGDLLVEGARIAAVGRGLTAQADEVIDARGRVVLPGMVNTHHHLYQVLTRNLPRVQDAKLFDWLLYLYDVWKHVTPEDVHAAALAGLGELLLTGCTLSADHHYLCPECVEGDPFEAEAAAARELGIRLHLTRGSMSLGRSAGGLPPDSVIQTEDRILNDSARVVERFHDPAPLSMCQVALAPCSPFSVTGELMREVAALARKLGVRLHTHLAETLDEERFCVEKFGRRPLELMEDLGWVGPDVWFAHSVYVNADEIRRMGKTRTGVAHCPVSNLRLGSGIAPVPAMLEAGVPVGLAVDGSASNDASNLLREAQIAMLVHRVGTGVAAMPARRALSIATTGGARVLGREDLGVLRPGLAADLALFDLRGLAYAGSEADPLAALLFCGLDSRAELVMVQGEVVVRDRHLVKVDEESISRRARDASNKLLRLAGVSS
ncbi:MAG TPA: 8-oxoguanine deaminase [Myxococcota bacterium]|nr:8-oxoguanine deaminase [Myxococcota bacterium]HRY96885.1 8-oxoguanine deaminase [Myxococcota bacterium]HSA22272.1 8-oxoguanine deaminase [Myxococcota bacterium]